MHEMESTAEKGKSKEDGAEGRVCWRRAEARKIVLKGRCWEEEVQ